MANRSLVRVVAVCFAMFSLAVGVAPRRKPPPKAKDALYDCLVKQTCECHVYQRFEDCWDKLTQVSRDYLVDELNKCDTNVTLPYGTLQNVMENLCPLGHSVDKPCYDLINPKLMERMKQAGSGELGDEEAMAFELMRKCVEPIMAYCSSFQDCMR